ncbi:hypothetical protein BC939DRAFT_429778 [Gamsiella multidivaricata]|uniref:uncharacterized protein n=1 Tax=Gamsiella multidivaricata TaxID=101098 RepID=UPI002221129E|nr:uncharacterized protein BC939DRAFT_429778 [Gamsiella multidivaricata]KAG0357576.1 hypothetical protein BGZ54_000277 [Gamsiella multidivaricata]KAI7816440.1 hypothetical protein BC939DRAFT_429778 [Gamsiella multidivaricata]
MGEKLTKKQKKTSEFRGKKRKLDDSIADVPEEDTPETSNDNSKETKDKKSSTSKKDTKDKSKKESKGESNSEETASLEHKKKRKRGKGTSKEEAKDGSAKETSEGDKEKEAKTAVKTAPKNQKFIVFVGNLPFNITKEQLEKHFESCGKISSVRVQTDKATGKGKGFAFMEFPDVESMQKALFFNKTLIKERPINVELTAGGGGNKSTARKQKIAVKNEALNEERRKLHEKHIAPAKEAKSSYAAANPPVVQKATPKAVKKPSEISGVNAISVEGLTARLRKG